ncbi:MAG: MATE family efflux transporter [Candidatus Yonathbacteria bacterium]|nr:MATE family efflux transporter [Candidatus Yonathbacteria bacterium]NTW47418.1 MATE family efflux transporter [Candidatus Yonathbacteria bacterium]
MSKLLEGPIITSLLALAVPIVLANILQTAYQLTDAFWVGRLGGAAVAAVSVSFPITFLLIALGGGLAIAGSTLIAQYTGAKNKEMVSHVAAQTLLMVSVVSVVLGIIGYTLAPSILRLMGVTSDVYTDALGFMRVSFVGILFTFITIMFQSIMRGIGKATLPMYIVLVTVVLNFALDPFFIFGWGGFPAYGVAGAALATFVTQALAAVAGLVVLFGGRHGIHLKVKDFTPDVPFMRKAFFLGLPASIEQSTRALSMTVMTFLITSFGTLAIAGYGVGSNVIQLVIIPSLGLSMAVSALVGQNIGAGNMKRAEDIARLGAMISFVALSVIGVISYIFAPHIMGFFVPGDVATIAVGVSFVHAVALTFGFIGIQMALLGVFRASGNMMTTMILTLVSQWVLQFPLAYILSKHTSLGVNGIWWAFPLTNILTTAITILWYMKGDWKNKKLTKEEKIEETVSEEIFVEEGVR